jgi:hypothetical protein
MGKRKRARTRTSAKDSAGVAAANARDDADNLSSDEHSVGSVGGSSHEDAPDGSANAASPEARRIRLGQNTERISAARTAKAKVASTLLRAQAELDDAIADAGVDIDEDKVDEQVEKLAGNSCPQTSDSLTEYEKALLLACGQSRVAASTLKRYLRIIELAKQFCSENGLPVSWVNAEASAIAAHRFLVAFVFHRLASSTTVGTKVRR